MSLFAGVKTPVSTVPSAKASKIIGYGAVETAAVVTFICPVIAVPDTTSSFKLIKIVAGFDGLMKSPSTRPCKVTLVIVGPSSSVTMSTAVGSIELSKPVMKPSVIVNLSAVEPKNPVVVIKLAVDDNVMSNAKELERATAVISEDSRD